MTDPAAPPPGLTLVTGPVKSGKSRFAEQLAAAAGPRVLYVATGVATDPEMASRIESHRQRRPSTWPTAEAPRHAVRAVGQALAAGGAAAILLDCLSTMLSNVLVEGEADLSRAAEAALGEADALAELAAGASIPVVVVTAEVGWGLVPMNPLGRAYQDVLGVANQRLAAAARQVYLCVAGIPLRLKPPG